MIHSIAIIANLFFKTKFINKLKYRQPNYFMICSHMRYNVTHNNIEVDYANGNTALPRVIYVVCQYYFIYERVCTYIHSFIEISSLTYSFIIL